MSTLYNSLPITSCCRTVCDIMGVACGEQPAAASEAVKALCEKAFAGRKADRALLYNPDAIALWLYQNYTHLFTDAMVCSQLAIPMLSVMPSVTPVCFGSMYTGLMPDDHGLHIRADLSGTEIGRQLYEEIKGGYTDKMSFGFTVDEDERLIQEDRESGTVIVLRTIKSIGKLYDVSAVSLPANNATEISARAFCEGVIAKAAEERRAAADRERRVRKIKILMEV